MVSLCPFCGRSYKPDRFNYSRQKGCARKDCVATRKRQRDRENYKRRYAEDLSFRDREKMRRSKCRREAKARARGGAGPPGSAQALVAGTLWPAVVELHETMTGMAALLAGERDGVSVQEFLSGCADRGRRLSRGPSLALSP
jgi:hypothetical protein